MTPASFGLIFQTVIVIVLGTAGVMGEREMGRGEERDVGIAELGVGECAREGDTDRVCGWEQAEGGTGEVELRRRRGRRSKRRRKRKRRRSRIKRRRSKKEGEEVKEEGNVKEEEEVEVKEKEVKEEEVEVK